MIGNYIVLILVAALIISIVVYYVWLIALALVQTFFRRSKKPVELSAMERMKALSRTQKRIEQAEEESEFEPRYYSELQRVEWHDFSEIDKIAKS